MLRNAIPIPQTMQQHGKMPKNVATPASANTSQEDQDRQAEQTRAEQSARGALTDLAD
jgi:hypothetical protein